MGIKRLHILIKGEVQGRGFRAFAKRVAEKYELSGWARNLEDGRVEVVLQGEEASLEGARRELRKGPPFARVQELEAKEEEPDPKVKGFTILS